MAELVEIDEEQQILDALREEQDAREDAQMAAANAMQELRTQRHVSGLVISVAACGRRLDEETVTPSFETAMEAEISTDALPTVIEELLIPLIHDVPYSWLYRLRLAWRVLWKT